MRRVAFEVAKRIHADRVFVPTGVERCQGTGNAHRRHELPQGMKLDHDVDLVANGFSDLLEGFERRLQVLSGNRPAPGFFRSQIKWPDLHGGNALVQQRLRKFVGPVEKSVEIVQAEGRAGGVKSPIAGRLGFALAHIMGAGAGVVGADGGPGPAAQKLNNRLAGDFAEQVPQRYINGGGGACFNAGRGKAQIIHEIARYGVDGERVAAHQFWRHCVMQIGLDSAGVHEGLAEAADALIGVDINPDEVAEFGDADGFKRGDLHRRLKSRRLRAAL